MFVLRLYLRDICSACYSIQLSYDFVDR